MYRFSKKVEYALMALLHMDGRRADPCVSVKEIAECHDIPQELLGKVLQTLGRAGLVASTKGVHGGYQLARPLEGVTVGEVIQALDGPIRLAACCDDMHACPKETRCNIRRPIRRVQEHVVAYISKLSLAEFREGPLAPLPDRALAGS